MKPVINLSDVELQPRPDSFVATGDAVQRFDADMGSIASRIGAKLLGYNITSIPAGKSAFPLHNHHVNEEMFLILDGVGELRMGSERFPLRKDDIIACPPGGPESAHQISNTGTGPLRFLALSTKLSPEYVEYPDSGKFAITADRGETRGRFMHVGRESECLDYWEGE